MTHNIINRLSFLNRVILLSSTLFLTFGCGPKSFQGRLAPAPEWVFVDLSKWDRKEVTMGENISLYGRGQSVGETLITNRRAIAEREAVRHAKTRFIELYKDHLAAAHYAALHIKATSELPWEQIALTSERYFDAKNNTQHALVAISEERLMAAVQFEQSADPARLRLWEALSNDLQQFYRVLRSTKGKSNTSLSAPPSL